LLLFLFLRAHERVRVRETELRLLHVARLEAADKVRQVEANAAASGGRERAYSIDKWGRQSEANKTKNEKMQAEKTKVETHFIIMHTA
jgi:hypothetical protein